VEDLRKELKPSGVKLTDEVEECWTAWASGDMFPDAIAAREKAAEAAADGAGAGPAVPAEPAPAVDVPMAPPAEAGAGVGSKRPSLAERAKAAKLRKA